MSCLPDYALVSASHQKMLIWRHKACKASLSNPLANNYDDAQTSDDAQTTTNTTNIAANTAAIDTNTDNIATNQTNIATNQTNIATNTANILTLTNTNTNTNTSGDIVYGGGANNNITLTTGVQRSIDTITLDQGLWNITCACNLNWSAGAIIQYAKFFVTTVGVGACETFTETVAVTTAVATVVGTFRSVVVNVSVDSLEYAFSVTPVFTAGTVTFSEPNIVGRNYLTATKLA